MADNVKQLKHRDRIAVYRGGKEIVVYNHVSVVQPMYVRANVVERFEPTIQAGNDPDASAPDYITSWLAEQLEWENINLPDHVEVVDLSSDEVTIA